MTPNNLVWVLVEAAQRVGFYSGDLPNRRERIATAALQGLIACGVNGIGTYDPAEHAVKLADRLIAELDKPAAEPSKDGAL